MKDEQLEKEYLMSTLDLVNQKLKTLKISSKKLEGVFDESNAEYFEYLKTNANKMNEDDFVEIINMQGRLDDLQDSSIDYVRMESIYNKMLDKPYFSSILLKEQGQQNQEKYYIGINSLVDDNKNFRVVDWRSPIASIFYDYEQGACQIKTNSSILSCVLLNKRQYGISQGQLNYFFDSTINIEDEILKSSLAQNSTNKMKSIVQTIQKEQNTIIRGDENKNLIVQGVAGSGKTAIALHRIAYLIYKMKGRITSKNVMFISPNNAFSSYISSVLPDLAEEDIEKVQLDLLARNYLKKNCIVEKKFEQVERLLTYGEDKEYVYKSSYKFLEDIIDYANKNYIDNFDVKELVIKDINIDTQKIKKLFFERYSDRDLFIKLKWITDNIFDMYFFKYKKPETVIKIKELIFTKLYSLIDNKNCVKAYMNFLKTKGMTLELVDNKVKNEDVYGILFFKLFIYGLNKFENIKHVIVDECQDYTPLQIYIINYLFECPKTLLGDYNQSIRPEFTRRNFDKLTSILHGDNEIVELNKSYRSTMEIAKFFNSIGCSQDVEVVSRNGEQVDLLCVKNDNKLKKLSELIEKYQKIGYTSIGIVTKTNSIAKKLFKEFSQINSGISLIDDNIDLYDNKVCIISAFNSKGLEFDAVIVLDGSEYNASESDRNIMYIASTRALHKLTILSIDNPSKLIQNYEVNL